MRRFRLNNTQRPKRTRKKCKNCGKVLTTADFVHSDSIDFCISCDNPKNKTNE